MKIIGISGYYNAEPSGFIVQMSATELNRLLNKSTAYRQASVGSEVNVHGMFDKLQWLDANGKTIESIVTKLRDVADQLEPMHTFTRFFCEGGK